MSKKTILKGKVKKECEKEEKVEKEEDEKEDGKGGPKTEKILNTLSNVGGMVNKAASGVYNTVNKGIKKYKDYVVEDKRLSGEAAKIQGSVSSNEGNVNEFLNIKRKLRDKAKNATTTPSTK